MKIACTADWHIHQFQEFSKRIRVYWDKTIQRYVPINTGKEMNSRLFNALDGLCDLRDYCIKNNIKHVLNAGDTFHKRGNINVDTFNAAYQVIESFQQLGISLFSIAGNHDQVDSSNVPNTSIHTFNHIQRIYETPSTITIHHNDLNQTATKIAAIPYSANRDWVLNHIQNMTGDILIAHLGVSGSIVGSGSYTITDEYSLADLQPEKWKYIVLGHYHRPQMLSPNVFYCGTPVQESFSDEMPITEHNGYNGFYVIDTNIKNAVEFIPIYKPRFITVNNVSKINDTDYFRIKSQESIDEPQFNVRVEMEKDYEIPARSSVSILDNTQEMLKKYAEENEVDSDTLAVGLQIVSELEMT